MGNGEMEGVSKAGMGKLRYFYYLLGFDVVGLFFYCDDADGGFGWVC